MSENDLKKEFEIRNLKYQNKQLLNKNTLINKQYNNLYQNFETRVEKEVKKRLTPMINELKNTLLIAKLAQDRENRLQIKLAKRDNRISELEQELKMLRKDNERLKCIWNNDGTNSGIPTSMTPIGKKKVIPNFAKKTGEKIGRKEGHKKDKLESVSEDKIYNVPISMDI